MNAIAAIKFKKMILETIQKLLGIVFRISLNAQKYFVNKNQNEVDRFVFCGLEKLNKISLTFLRLYPQLDYTEQLEFSLGILARSILMDMILVMEIKNTYRDFKGETIDELKENVRQCCYKLINDGTSHLLEEIYASETLSEEEKKEKGEILISIFSKAFDTSKGKPRLKTEFKFRLAEIAANAKDQVFSAPIVNMYSYYSKYDHLSHWTSLSSHVSFDFKKGKLNLAILLMMPYLRDLCLIAVDYDDNYKILLEFTKEIENELNQIDDQEFI